MLFADFRGAMITCDSLDERYNRNRKQNRQRLTTDVKNRRTVKPEHILNTLKSR